MKFNVGSDLGENITSEINGLKLKALDFEVDEAKILVDEDCHPTDIVLRERGFGEKLIEDFFKKHASQIGREADIKEDASEIIKKLMALGTLMTINNAVDFETAEKCFENSLYEPFEAMSYYQLAKIYAFKGEKDKAIMHRSCSDWY